ncbi:MAG: hypothetical protein WDO24_11945 [Pseudomonadota bacterium]
MRATSANLGKGALEFDKGAAAPELIALMLPSNQSALETVDFPVRTYGYH